MIQAARHLAAFWPNQAQTDKNKDPSEASLRSCTHVLPHRRLGSGGAWKRPAFLDFEPDRFRNLYQIAHSERRWKSGITPHVASTQQLETEGAEHARPKSGHILPA